MSVRLRARITDLGLVAIDAPLNGPKRDGVAKPLSCSLFVHQRIIPEASSLRQIPVDARGRRRSR